jgi:hypothetical protein
MNLICFKTKLWLKLTNRSSVVKKKMGLAVSSYGTYEIYGTGKTHIRSSR